MPRRMLLLMLIAAFAAAGCSDDADRVGLSEAEACKAVREHLDAEGIEKRFGKPTSTQDFFGDKVITFARSEVTWQFQLTEQAGTFRALQVKGKREKILACPRRAG